MLIQPPIARWMMLRSRTMLACLLLLDLLSVSAQAEIYRCSNESRSVQFSDRPCAGGEGVRLSEGTGIVMPALTAAEAQRVRELDARSAEQRSRANREESRAARARALVAEKNRAACANAAEKLAQLR